MKLRASAPGKIILLGEHAVVYNQPAIAIPLSEVRATATISPGSTFTINAVDLEQVLPLESFEQELDNALLLTAKKTFELLGQSSPPNVGISLQSDIPIASGLGSGASVSTALARAIMLACKANLADEQLNGLIFEIEKLHHKLPSGIDNTVVVYEKPIYFIRKQPIQEIKVGQPFTFLIADTGLAAPTSVTVSDVKTLLESQPARYEPIIESIGYVVQEARGAMADGDHEAFGSWMNHNHTLLQELTVSSLELDHLVETACKSGAFGAKLSGGGRGGNMIALVEPQRSDNIKQALIDAGAVRVLESTLEQSTG